jgi:hypothetical protein
MKSAFAFSALPVTLGLALLAQPALAAPAFQDDPLTPGISFEGARQVGEFDAYATLPDGNRVVFDGLEVRLVADDGTLVAVLGTTSRFGFPAFVLPDPTYSYALVAESSAGKIRRVDLAGGGMTFVAHLDFAYDAVFEDGAHVLLTAAPCGFNCGSEVYRLDLASGTLALVASVQSPSGPLTLSPEGDLIYGLQSSAFPPQPVPILRWTKAQIESGTVLLETDATTFAPGLNAPTSMKVDPVSGHLLVADSVFQGTSRILEFTASGLPVGSLVESSQFLSGVEPLGATGPGSFGAFSRRASSSSTVGRISSTTRRRSARCARVGRARG